MRYEENNKINKVRKPQLKIRLRLFCSHANDILNVHIAKFQKI